MREYGLLNVLSGLSGGLLPANQLKQSKPVGSMDNAMCSYIQQLASRLECGVYTAYHVDSISLHWLCTAKPSGGFYASTHAQRACQQTNA